MTTEYAPPTIGTSRTIESCTRRRHARSRFGFALVVASCGGGKSQDAGPRDVALFASGSRLHAHVHDGGDGARVLIDWNDSVTGERCTFQLAEDGAMRCLPLMSRFNQLAYDDASCTQPIVVRARAECGAHESMFAFGRQPDRYDLCGEPGFYGSIYRSGSAIPRLATVYYDDGALCRSVPLSAGQEAYAAEKVDLATLPLAQVVAETSAGNAARIVPYVATTAVADKGCGSLKLFALGPEHTGATYSNEATGVCARVPRPDDTRLFQAGAPIDPTAFPEVRDVTE